jgi:uncharacterized damage-inducible protein DinB
MSGVASLRHQARLTREVVRLNLEGISHEESLIQPRPAGNCLNWVLGHLLTIYNELLPLLGQPQVLPSGALAPYARGSSPITRPSEALPLQDLVSAWNEAAARVDAGLAELPAERLMEPVPDSPTGDPDETTGSLLFTVLFHQAYHAGQLGILRRIAGKPGAIT